MVAACLGLQCTPTSGWLCSYCRDKFVPGRKTVGDAGPIMIRLTRVVKAPESEGGGCVVCRYAAVVVLQRAFTIYIALVSVYLTFVIKNILVMDKINLTL